MNTICCYDAYGQAVMMPVEAVVFCPAVYGIFIENNQVLLLRHPQTSFWYPPGRMLTNHETPAQAVRHHFRYMTGMIPHLGPLIFVEDLYHIDDNKQAWHISAMYYALARAQMAITTLANLTDSPQPEWVLLEALQRQQMQFGYKAIQAGRLRLRL